VYLCSAIFFLVNITTSIWSRSFQF